MSPRSRHRNRGSRSFPSNDLLRSIARGRSYHTVEASVSNSDFRSQSSLSCDPNAQAQPTINQTDSSRHGFSMSFNRSVLTSRNDVDPGFHARTVDSTSNGPFRDRKRRKLSWLSKPWSKVMKDGKQHSMISIPPTTSMSSISKSSISSPVLTSTTNPRVANAEKVKCSEILFPIPSPSEFHSHNDNSPDVDESSTSHGLDNTSSWTSSVRNIRAKLSHSRRASTGVLLTSSWSRRTHGRWETAAPASISSHRKAKRAVRGKLQHLGERLHVLPTETGNVVFDNAKSVKAKEIQHDQASRTPTPRATPLLPGLHSDSTTDLLRGSLSRSFASAVDKLGLDSSPTLVHYSPSMATLRKVKTMMGMKEKYDDDGKLSSKRKTTPSKPLKTDVSKLSRYEDKTQTFDSPAPKEAFKTRADRQVRKPGVIGRNNHPDPLRSFPDVMTFAASPEDTPLPASDDTDYGSEDEDQDHKIQEAIVYSESTGDLSRYTRTPSPPAKKPEAEVIKTRVFEETPTKQPTFGRLKKSVSGFFVKSASKMRLVSSTSRHAKIQEESEQRYVAPTPADLEASEPVTPAKLVIYDHQPFTPSPLRHSSKPDVSEISDLHRQRAATLPSTAGFTESESKHLNPRSPPAAVDSAKRRAVYDDVLFKNRDFTKSFDE